MEAIVSTLSPEDSQPAPIAIVRPTPSPTPVPVPVVRPTPVVRPVIVPAVGPTYRPQPKTIIYTNPTNGWSNWGYPSHYSHGN